MNTDKVKKHFNTHKKTYTTLGAGVLLGVSTTLIFTKTQAGNNAVQKVIAFKTGDVTQNVVQMLARRGHPGNVIRCVETGETFASQNRAAELLNLSRYGLTEHLKGCRDSVNGLHFEKLGEAVA